MRCPWYFPHLRSLCTRCFMNFLSSPGDSQNVLSSSHPTLTSFRLCRFSPPHSPVLFSPFTPCLPQRLPLPDTQRQSSPTLCIHHRLLFNIQTLFCVLLDQTLVPPTLPFPNEFRFLSGVVLQSTLSAPEILASFFMCSSLCHTALHS